MTPTKRRIPNPKATSSKSFNPSIKGRTYILDSTNRKPIRIRARAK
jgi:hypothetical protein